MRPAEVAPRPGPRWLLAAAMLGAGVLALAGCGGGGGDTTSGGDSTQAQAGHHSTSGGSSSAGISSRTKRQASRRLARELGVSKTRIKQLQGGQGLAATSIRPAQIVPGGPGPFFSSDVIWPIQNGWEASDHRSYTAVDAGVNPADHSMGELGIFRQDFAHAGQSQHVVDVPGAGALRITAAPLGRAAATSAQQDGNLRFVGTRGVRGTLHLQNDTVTTEGGTSG